MDNSATKDEEKRSFEVEGLGKFSIAIPTADDIRQSDWSYSKTYNKALVEGVTTQGEMFDILTRRNILGDHYEKRGEELRTSIGEKIIEMEVAQDKEKRRELAVSVAQLREDLFAWNQRVSGPMSNTCEQIAEDARLDFLTSCIIQKEDGTRKWPDFDIYLDEPNRALAYQARLEVMLFLQGLDTDFLEKTPENVVLKELRDEEIAVLEKEEAAAEAEKAEAAKPAAKKPRRGRKPRAKKVVSEE